MFSGCSVSGAAADGADGYSAQPSRNRMENSNTRIRFMLHFISLFAEKCNLMKHAREKSGSETADVDPFRVGTGARKFRDRESYGAVVRARCGIDGLMQL